jgi:hypothetical protein
MQYSRQQVVEMLWKAGLFEEADVAAEELPDPVGLYRVQEWGMRRGITRDVLISRVGGSP